MVWRVSKPKWIVHIAVNTTVFEIMVQYFAVLGKDGGSDRLMKLGFLAIQAKAMDTWRSRATSFIGLLR